MTQVIDRGKARSSGFVPPSVGKPSFGSKGVIGRKFGGGTGKTQPFSSRKIGRV